MWVIVIKCGVVPVAVSVFFRAVPQTKRYMPKNLNTHVIPSPVQETMREILAGLLYDLCAEQVQVEEINEAFFFGKSSGAVGWWQMAFARAIALRFLANMAAKAKVSSACLEAMAELTPGALAYFSLIFYLKR